MAGTEQSLIALAGLASSARGGGRAAAGVLRTRLHALVEASDLGGAVALDTPGMRNQRLLRLHRRLVGGRLEACAACPACGEKNEFDVPADALLALAPVDRHTRLALGGSVFRLPRVADLDALDLREGADPVGWQIAAACRIEGDGPLAPALVDDLGRAFDAADPAADVTLSLECATCEAAFPVTVDVPLLVGEACVRLAEALLREVDVLASAYGWTEPAILVLPPERRRSYVAMIAARREAGGARPRLVGRQA